MGLVAAPLLSGDGNSMFFSSTVAAAATAIPDAVDCLLTGGYYDQGDGGGALYIRTGSLVTGGFIDAGGGFWELGEQELNPKMFGAKADGSDDTSPLSKMFDVVVSNEYSFNLLGLNYLISGPITPLASQSFRKIVGCWGGDATITVDLAASEMSNVIFLYSSNVGDFWFGGGSLTIECNNKSEIGFYLGSTNADDNILSVSGVVVKNCYGHTTDVATCIGFYGAWAKYGELNNLIADGASRPSSSGACTGILFRPTGASTDVPFFDDCEASNVVNATADADGVKITSDISGGIPIFQKVVFNNLVTKNNQGRHIKSQCASVDIFNPIAEWSTVTPISGGSYCDSQLGSQTVINAKFNVSVSLGSSFIFHSIQQKYLDKDNKTSLISGCVLNSSHSCRNFACIFLGANSPNSNVILRNNVFNAVGALLAAATTIFTRSIVEFSASELNSSANNLYLEVDSNRGPFTVSAIGYTGYNGTDDLSSKLQINVHNNVSILSYTGGTKVFGSLSGSDILLVAKFRFKGNRQFSNYMPNGWTVNLSPASVSPDCEWTQQLSSASFTNGPTFAGGSDVYISTGHSSYPNYCPVTVIVDNAAVANRYFYTLTGTWGTIK